MNDSSPVMHESGLTTNWRPSARAWAETMALIVAALVATKMLSLLFG